jgi:hypothetical protein
MPSATRRLRRARRAASLRVQLSSYVSVCTIRSLRAQSAGASFRPAAGSDMSERGWATSHRTIRVREAHKSLHRRSHKGGRGGGLMSARRASRRLTGGAPGIPGNNNQPPRRQQRVSVAGRLSLGPDDFLTRLQDRLHRPAVPTPQVQDVLGAKHDAHRVVPAEGTRRVLNAGPAARQVLRRASRVTAAVAMNRKASHIQIGNLYAGQTA